jgi:hypothetical protein
MSSERPKFGVVERTNCGEGNTVRKNSVSHEGTPLLYEANNGVSNGVHKLAQVEMVRDEIEDFRGKLLKFEFVKILKMSGPVIFAYMLQNSLQTGSVLVVGRLVSSR